MRIICHRRSVAVAAVLWVVSLAFIGCHRSSATLVIENGVTPRFVLSEPATLTNFQITGADLDRESNRDGKGDRLTLRKVYWELA